MKLDQEPFRLASVLAEPLVEAFKAQWEMVETDLHYAGALLNPYLLEDKKQADDQNETDACKRVVMEICKPGKYPNVVKEFMAF